LRPFGRGTGELLKRAEQEFDVLVTADRNLPRQQNLSGRRIAFRRAAEKPAARRRAVVPDLDRVLDTIQPGTLVVL
jgi:hypothetical protein